VVTLIEPNGRPDLNHGDNYSFKGKIYGAGLVLGPGNMLWMALSYLPVKKQPA
jgi:hypothetical protein